jgi:hypothetical protein
MNKYLQFAIEDFEPAQVPINGGLFVGVVAETSIKLHSSDNASIYTVVGTGLTVASADAINQAIILAAQTNWMKVEHLVMIPKGEVITGVTVGAS